jgi:CBS-domain-containing membrane protein
MATLHSTTILSELIVKTAMRRQIVKLPPGASLAQCIRYLIKFRVNGLLVSDEEEAITGVVSKTDLMGAFYAGLPIEGPVSDIMSSPPLYCREEESLAQVLNTMRERRVYRLYVHNSMEKVSGVIAYPDIVGVLYTYCRECPQSRWQHSRRSGVPKEARRFKVREIMTPSVTTFGDDDTLASIMEGLSANRIGAVLIHDHEGRPAGVVSKTDLLLAYRHGMPTEAGARQIMNTPAQKVDQEECLENALQQLIFSQLHRLFVFKEVKDNIVGVLSLSDVARMRSGSCQACIMSRIRLEVSNAQE